MISLKSLCLIFSPAIVFNPEKIGIDLQAPSANAVFKRKTPFPAANIQILLFKQTQLSAKLIYIAPGTKTEERFQQSEKSQRDR